MKEFNTTGLCIPDKHYMVNIDDKLAQIQVFVDNGNYFVINRSRQYGKTTTLRQLAKRLKEKYIVFSLDFQRMSNTEFQDEETFCETFLEIILRKIQNRQNPILGISGKSVLTMETLLKKDVRLTLRRLFDCLSDMCFMAEKPIVLMIDEVDGASNNQVFLDFLSQLRAYYLERDEVSAFHSVILAGVHDIRNLKRRIRPKEEHKLNSPWNIAMPFEVDMSLSEKGIAGMLQEYEQDYHTGMCVGNVARAIHDYTAGYPYLVSLICKVIAEELFCGHGWLCGNKAWSQEGVSEAVKLILKMKNPLFDSLMKQMSDYPELRKMVYAILFQGKRIALNRDMPEFDLGMMFGFISEKEGQAVISNRIFETRLYNYFLAEEQMESYSYDAGQALEKFRMGIKF